MADQTYNEALFDAMVRHQIGLLRYSSSVRNKIWKVLDATEADLKRQIKALGAGAGYGSAQEIKRLQKLLASLKATRVKAWKDVTALWTKEMKDLAVAEPGFFERTIVAAAPGVELAFVLPDATDMRNIATSTPFQGKVLKDWAKDLQIKDIARIEDQIKIGLYQKESLPALSRRIVGTARLAGRNGATQVTRRGAASIVRTVVSGIGAETRRAFAEANADVLPQEVFIATLDSGTTPICRSLDGNVYDVGTGPRLPLHFGERSVYGPALDGKAIGERPIRNFTNQSLLREFSDQQGFKAPRTRAKLPRGTKGAFDKFARKRMRELTGQVPARTTYSQFLKRQSAAIQDDILGKTKGRLFRKGGLTLDKFVDASGKELTLVELASRHTEEFLRAGLDPALFQ